MRFIKLICTFLLGSIITASILIVLYIKSDPITVEEYNEVASKYNSLLDEIKRARESSVVNDIIKNTYDELVGEYNSKVDELESYKDIFKIDADSTEIDIEIPEIPKDCVGYLYVPTCDISALIKQGTTMKAISNYHVGEFEESEELGKGNYSLAGHANAERNYVFSHLENISLDDPIYIYKDNIVYKFKVGYMRDVDADNVWILENTGTDIATCTLMCCTDSGKRRFVVFGNFISSKEIKNEQGTEN